MSDSCSGGERLGFTGPGRQRFSRTLALSFSKLTLMYTALKFLFFFKGTGFLVLKNLDQNCKNVFKRLKKQHKNQTKTNHKALLVKAISLKYVSPKGLLKSSLVPQLMIGLYWCFKLPILQMPLLASESNYFSCQCLQLYLDEECEEST